MGDDRSRASFLPSSFNAPFFYRKVDTFRKKKHVTIVIVRGEEPTFGRVTVYQSVSSSVVHFKWVFFSSSSFPQSFYLFFFFPFQSYTKEKKILGRKKRYVAGRFAMMDHPDGQKKMKGGKQKNEISQEATNWIDRS